MQLDAFLFSMGFFFFPKQQQGLCFLSTDSATKITGQEINK
jgi:hypothetical protein